MDEKKVIRNTILQCRDSLELSLRNKYNKEIIKKLTEMEAFRNAVHILCYVNFRSEVSTKEFIEYALSEKKRVYCPKVLEKKMEFYQISGIQDLKVGTMGILEPECCLEKQFRGNKNENALVIIPGAVFDKRKGRIGYGGGYYDRYLKEYPDIFKIAIAYSVQIVEAIPQNIYDIKPDIIISEKGVLL